MKKKVWILDTTAEILFYALIVIGSFYAMISPFSMEHSGWQVIGGGLVFCVLFYWVCHRQNWMRYLLLAAGLLLIGIVLLRGQIAEGILYAAETLLPYINSYFGGRLELSGSSAGTGPEVLFLTILYLWAGLCACSYFLIRKKAFASVLIIVVSVFPALLGQFPEVLPVSFVLLGWTGMQVMGTAQSRLAKGRLAVTAAVLFLVVLAGFWFVLQPRFEKMRQDSIEYKLLIKEADYEAVWDRIPLLNQYEFLFGIGDFGTAGITNGDLTGSGGFFKSKKAALEITLDYRPRQTIYLRGYSGTNYTGVRWEEISAFDGGGIEGLYDEICGDIQSLGYLDIEMKNEHLETVDPEQAGHSDVMKIEIQGANEQYLYTPYFADLRGRTGMVGDLYLLNMAEEDSYEIPFYSQEEAAGINENIYDRDGIMRFGDEMLSEYGGMYLPYYDESYLQLPDRGLERLISQCEEEKFSSVDEITEYIRETLSGIPYNQSVDRVPAEEDFTEYFLYELREGYCVHFATTATLMYRIFEVPSRYVTGYVVPPSLFSKNEDGTYTAQVPADKAHAWAEIYTWEDGWTYVEMTPGYGGNSMSVSGQTGTVNPYQSEERQSTARNETERNNNRDKKTAGQSGGSIRVILYCIAGLGAVLLFVLGIAGQRKIRCQKRLKGTIRELFYSVHELIVFAGFSEDIDYRNPQIQKEICDRFHLENTALQKAVELAYEVNFSPASGGREDKAFMKTFYSSLADEVYGQLRLKERLIYRYIRCFG